MPACLCTMPLRMAKAVFLCGDSIDSLGHGSLLEFCQAELGNGIEGVYVGGETGLVKLGKSGEQGGGGGDADAAALR